MKSAVLRAPRVAFASLFGLVVAVGCSSTTEEPAATPKVPLANGAPWPKFRGDAAQTGFSPVKPSKTGGTFWSFKTGKGLFSHPVVAADGTVYFGSADRFFYAVNADGSLRWKVETGEVVDSPALLDDKGRVYFGSGDGKLRALDAKTGATVWEMTADDPAVNSAFINWFESGVAMGPDGTLYAPNDNFFVYAVNRDTGAPTWRFKMPDQTWSLPAVDAKTGNLFIGNNNLLPLLGKNTFAIDAEGSAIWSAVTTGTVAASPMLTPDGTMIVSGFDGYVRAYSMKDGTALWSFATRDHIYASAGRQPDGTIVVSSADGTIYGLAPRDGALKWSFDSGAPVRSSPAIDGDGNVYFGGGDGRLYVLNPGGTLRFAMRLLDDVRDDLNASPALGRDAVYLGGETGEMFSVPYDFCLRPDNAADTRCTVTASPRADGATLEWLGAFGATAIAAPSQIEGNGPLTMLLAVREGGAQKLATLDATTVKATLTPPADVTVDVSGDGRVLTLTPKSALPAGPLSISIEADFLVDHARDGLRVTGGRKGGTAKATFTTEVRARGAGALDPAGAYEVHRLAIPQPTLMPSYNQIGFDSLHYLLGTVTTASNRGIGWMVGGLKAADGTVQVDPATKALFPLTFDTDGDLATFQAQAGLRVQVMSFDLPMQSFRVAMHFAPGGDAAGTAALTGSAVCNGIPFYGPFLQVLGLCNAQTDELRVLGGSNVTRRVDLRKAPAVGNVTFTREAEAIKATLTGSQVKLADHLVSLLVVDSAPAGLTGAAATVGLPVTLEYGLGTTRTTNGDGSVATVQVPTKGVTLPTSMKAYLIVDVGVAATGDVPALP